MKCKRYILAIGMNDSKTLKQELSKDFIITAITNCCKKYNCPFSWSLTNGGYVNNNNEYIEENSVVLSIINPKSSELVNNIAKELCALLNQECISVTIDEVDRYLVSVER